jgi:hypothetical protein
MNPPVLSGGLKIISYDVTIQAMSIRETLAVLGKDLSALVHHDHLAYQIEEARAGCLAKRSFIQYHIDHGIVSKDKLDAMVLDEKLQSKFMTIARASGEPRRESYLQIKRDIAELGFVEQIAFWAFWVKYTEIRFGIDTSPKPSDS